MKISLITTSLMFLLFVNIAFATTAYTEYTGSGDFKLQTSILSEVTPIIYDSATIHTGCNGGCCCCPECSGKYEGLQLVTNSPLSAAIDVANVTNGCVALEQNIIDNFDNRTAETNYYTYLDGSGTAKSYIYATPGQGLSYQLANGTGSAYASFNQVVFLNGNFDYETTYGGASWVCGPGYVGIVNSYDFYNTPAYYNPKLGLYCYPINQNSILYAFLFAKSTDIMKIDSHIRTDAIRLNESIDAAGFSDYGKVIASHDGGDFIFDFEMKLDGETK